MRSSSRSHKRRSLEKKTRKWPTYISRPISCSCDFRCVLLHLVYRFVILAVYGNVFPSWENGYVSTCTVCLHALLHATSFIPHVPHRRYDSKPMIWPEFRVHNAIFSMRHVLCTLCALHLNEPLAYRAAIVLLAMGAADLTTQRMGSYSDRTTNAMPYPDHANKKDVLNTKLFYGKAQFHATAWAIVGTPTLAWFPLLGLEGSSFLMTLVREGIVTSRTYHLLYSMTLWAAYPVLLRSLVTREASLHPGVIFAGYVAHKMRVRMKWSKYLSWLFTIACLRFSSSYGFELNQSHTIALVVVVGGALFFLRRLSWLLS